MARRTETTIPVQEERRPEEDSRYEFRSGRLLDVLRDHPEGLSAKRLTVLAAMKRDYVHGTLRKMLADGLVERDVNGTAHIYRVGPNDDGRTAEAIASEKRAARVDPELHMHGAPLGYRLRGASTMLNRDGEPVLTWVKTAKEQFGPDELLEMFTEAVIARNMPAAAYVPPPAGVMREDLVTIYPMGDPHLGLLSWHAETGEDFDLRIAEANLRAAVAKLVSLAPPSKKALIIDLGDFLHADNLDAVTARSGHSLDVDSRWSKVMRVGVLVMTQCIDCALEKHDEVHVIIEIGNHNDHSALMMAICLSHHYRDNPRVHVDTSPSPFHWFEFGRNLIGVTHGHNTKPQDLPGIMAADKPESWGRTKHRYWYTGHVHHEVKKEYPGCIVESFRTLAARDFWHHSKGYRSGRSMVCDVLHAEHGRIIRHEVGISQLEMGK